MKLKELFESYNFANTLTRDFKIGDFSVDSDGLFERFFNSYNLIGSWNCSGLKGLVALDGSPKSVSVSYRCANCPDLETFEGAPEIIGRYFEASNCPKITSLEGIGVKYLQDIGRGIIIPETVTSHILGILKIKNVHLVEISTDDEYPEIEEACNIINKHLNSGRRISKCREELIEAGLKEYAKL